MMRIAENQDRDVVNREQHMNIWLGLSFPHVLAIRALFRHGRRRAAEFRQSASDRARAAAVHPQNQDDIGHGLLVSRLQAA